MEAGHRMQDIYTLYPIVSDPTVSDFACRSDINGYHGIIGQTIILFTSVMNMRYPLVNFSTKVYKTTFLMFTHKPIPHLLDRLMHCIRGINAWSVHLLIQ